MGELRTALQDYAEATSTQAFKDEDFHTMKLFDVDILLSNFQYADVNFMANDFSSQEKEYTDVISKYTWKMYETDKGRGMLVPLKRGKLVDRIQGTLVNVPRSTRVRCVHYILPKEEYSIWCSMDSIPRGWYPMPRQELHLSPSPPLRRDFSPHLDKVNE